jgi:uncharacterized protein GlcG (DUF336 family)
VVSLFEKIAVAPVELREASRFARTGAMLRLPSSFFAALLAPAALALAPLTAYSQALTLADVQRIMAQAISRAEITSPNALIAVTDREGFVVGVWSVAGGNPTADRIGAAISEAGTPTYLSTNENAFSSRTAQFVIQQNFPEGVNNRAPGPLVGIEFSQLPFSDANHFKRIAPGPNGEVPGMPGGGFAPGGTPASLGTGIFNTRLSGRSSGFPLYKGGQLVGGIGVFSGLSDDLQRAIRVELSNTPPGPNEDEMIALTGQIGFAPNKKILATNVFIDGIRLPYAAGVPPKIRKRDIKPIGAVGSAVPGFPLSGAAPDFPYPVEFLGGRPVVIRAPIIDDPKIAIPIRGQQRLTAEEVRGIIGRVAARAFITRSAIKNPIGRPAEIFVSIVGNPDAPGEPAPILATARTIGSNLFDANDVCPQKARTALFFSSDTFAASTRTVGFLAQNFYPPGINGQPPGPNGPDVPDLNPDGTVQLNPDGSVNISAIGLQVLASVNVDPVTLKPFIPVAPPQPPEVPAPTSIPPNPALPDGVNLFGGGFPLYRNGVLIGALGASGDGIEVDDLLGASGIGLEFAAPDAIRADQFSVRGTQLPYAKFPRDPVRKK